MATRNKKNSSEARNITLSFRVSGDELEVIESRLKMANMTREEPINVSEFIRRLVVRV